MPTIALENLTVSFDQHFVLNQINWQIAPAQHWAITGPNGAGKSALAAVLHQQGAIQSGTISNLPSAVASVSFEAQAALIEAECKQDDADLVDVISAGTPVQEILDQTCVDKDLQKTLIQQFALGDLLDLGFRKLSSGETRKAMLIRALTSNPELLILDEPFAGLDQAALEYLSNLLQHYSHRVQLVMVLNRFDDIPQYISHIAYIDNGMLLHRVERNDQTAVANLTQLRHLKTSHLSIPAADSGLKTPPLNPDEPLVRMCNARIAYGDKVIFSNLDWRVEPGQHWQITGPNGSGKTCLLNLITGDHPQCYVNDLLIFGMQRGNGESIWDIKQHIGYVSSALQWQYKVSVSARNAIISGFYDSIGIYQHYSDNQKAIADQWLQLLGMRQYADSLFSQLSFGDQRLILIARAMVKHPPLLILDEPCLGLDDMNRQLVLALIEKICGMSATTVLYVNHRAQDNIANINQHLAMGVPLSNL